MSSNQKPNIFNELVLAEEDIIKEVSKVHGDHQKILEIYAKRISLHTRFAMTTSDPVMKAIIETKKFVVINELAIVNNQDILQQDIAKIISRLDNLEEGSQDQEP